MDLGASILSADFARLGDDVAAACEAGIRRVHVDVMDGHFVANLSGGPKLVHDLRPVCDRYGAELNVHLMVEHPERFVADFADAGAHGIAVHVEATLALRRVLRAIRARGLSCGVAINPSTAIARVLDTLDDSLDAMDWCLVMTVEPGFGGQQMIPACLDKVLTLARKKGERPSPLIAVDGGVHVQTIKRVRDAGANVAVVGSALFGAQTSVADNLAALRAALGGDDRPNRKDGR
jgi:ribulose-phosphate 3-epimerase